MTLVLVALLAVCLGVVLGAALAQAAGGRHVSPTSTAPVACPDEVQP